MGRGAPPAAAAAQALEGVEPRAVVLVEGRSDQRALEALAERRGRKLAAAVEQVIDGQGELGSFRTFQGQPPWRARSREAQLRRFIGTRGGRKINYAHLLVDVLDLTRVPRPLDRLLAHL